MKNLLTTAVAIVGMLVSTQVMAWGNSTAPNDHISPTSFGAWMSDVNDSLNPWNTPSIGGFNPTWESPTSIGTQYPGLSSSPYGETASKDNYNNWRATWTGHATGFDKQVDRGWLGYIKIKVKGTGHVESYFYSVIRENANGIGLDFGHFMANGGFAIDDLPKYDNRLVGRLSEEDGFIGVFSGSDTENGAIIGQFWDRNNDPNSKPEGVQGVYYHNRGTDALGDDNVATFSTYRRN